MTRVSREPAFLREIQAYHGRTPEIRLWRNNVGKYWTGEFKYLAKEFIQRRLHPGDVVLGGARRVTSGLAEGSSDLIGIKSVPVSSLDPASCVAIFTSLEAKTGGTATEAEQMRWVRMVLALGGIAGVVKSIEDSVKLLGDR